MAELDKRYIFRMTHIKNVAHILQYGVTHVSSHNSNPNFVPIGDASLISTRSCFMLNNGRQLGQYIPFYFGVRTPMLFVIQKGYNLVSPTPAENIVYLISTVRQIMDHRLNFVFTDGHAVDGFTQQFDIAHINEIDSILDLKAINAKYWKSETDLDLKRRKEAEFLVDGDIPSTAILGFGVYNDEAKSELLALGIDENRIVVKPAYYF